MRLSRNNNDLFSRCFDNQALDCHSLRFIAISLQLLGGIESPELRRQISLNDGEDMNVEVVDIENTELDRRSFLEQCSAMLLTTSAMSSGTSTSSQQSSSNQPAPKGSTLNFFPGFKAIREQTTGAVINGVIGGS